MKQVEGILDVGVLTVARREEKGGAWPVEMCRCWEIALCGTLGREVQCRESARISLGPVEV